MRGVKTKSSGNWKKISMFFVLLLVFGLLLNSVNKVYQKKKGAEELLVRMQTEMQELEVRKAKLGVSLERLKTDEGLEFELKRKLNVAEVGESVAIIVEDGATSIENTPNPSIWQKFKDRLNSWFD